MFKRLKRALVESFVGAIALGWLFAQGIIHFVGVFSSPVAAWIRRNEYRGLPDSTTTSAGSLLPYSLA